MKTPAVINGFCFVCFPCAGKWSHTTEAVLGQDLNEQYEGCLIQWKNSHSFSWANTSLSVITRWIFLFRLCYQWEATASCWFFTKQVCWQGPSPKEQQAKVQNPHKLWAPCHFCVGTNGHRKLLKVSSLSVSSLRAIYNTVPPSAPNKEIQEKLLGIRVSLSTNCSQRFALLWVEPFKNSTHP